MDDIGGNLLHLWINDFEKIEFRILLLDELIKLLVVYLISFLELTVVRQVFLNCIVS